MAVPICAYGEFSRSGQFWRFRTLPCFVLSGRRRTWMYLVDLGGIPTCFTVAGALQTCRVECRHFPFRASHSSHFTLYSTTHSTLHVPTLHTTLYTLYISPATLYIHFTLCTHDCTLPTLHHTPHFTPYTSHFALLFPHSTL